MHKILFCNIILNSYSLKITLYLPDKNLCQIKLLDVNL